MADQTTPDGLIVKSVGLPVAKNDDGSVTMCVEGFPSFVAVTAATEADAKAKIIAVADRYCQLQSGYLTQYAREHGRPMSDAMRGAIRAAFERVYGLSCDGRPLA